MCVCVFICEDRYTRVSKCNMTKTIVSPAASCSQNPVAPATLRVIANVFALWTDALPPHPELCCEPFIICIISVYIRYFEYGYIGGKFVCFSVLRNNLTKSDCIRFLLKIRLYCLRLCVDAVFGSRRAVS